MAKQKQYYRLPADIGNAVLAKYNHQCIECGSKKNLCVHHKIRMHPKDPNYTQIENLTVLCKPCHMRHHRKAGDVVPKTVFRKGHVANPNGRRGKNVPIIFCSEPECGLKQFGQGLCKKHYEYKRRHKQLPSQLLLTEKIL